MSMQPPGQAQAPQDPTAQRGVLAQLLMSIFGGGAGNQNGFDQARFNEQKLDSGLYPQGLPGAPAPAPAPAPFAFAGPWGAGVDPATTGAAPAPTPTPTPRPQPMPQAAPTPAPRPNPKAKSLNRGQY